MRHGYREITRESKHSLFKTQLLKWVGGTGTGLVGERTAGMVGSCTRCRRPATVDQSC